MPSILSIPSFQGVVVQQLLQRPWTPCMAALKLFDWRVLLPWILRLFLYSPSESFRGVARSLSIIAAMTVICSRHQKSNLAVYVAPVLAWFVYSNRRVPRPVLIFKPQTDLQASPAWLATFVQEHRLQLKELADQYGALLFRDFGLTKAGNPTTSLGLDACVRSAETVLEAAQMQPTAFFGQAPRWQPSGWRYLFRNVAFEAAAAGQGFFPWLRLRLGLVWSKAPQYLTFHNEMAYLDINKHLGAYGVFFVPLASKIGGFTPVSDARVVLQRVKQALGSQFPVAMKWVLARKRKAAVPKQKSGGYLDFLLGKFELDSVEDQFWPTRRLEEIKSLAANLDLEVTETDDEIVISSRWIAPERPMTDGSTTWWCNGNHLAVGSQDVFGRPDALQGLPWLFRFGDGTERPATMEEILKISWAWWQEAAFFNWKSGDILIFNNQVVAHNASPGLGVRMVLPSFGKCWV